MRSDGLQVCSRQLAALADHIVADLLTFVEAGHPRALDRGDVHEHILSAVRRLNESKAFLRIEKLHGTLSHVWPPLQTPIGVVGLRDHRAASRPNSALSQGACKASRQQEQAKSRTGRHIGRIRIVYNSRWTACGWAAAPCLNCAMP